MNQIDTVGGTRRAERRGREARCSGRWLAILGLMTAAFTAALYRPAQAITVSKINVANPFTRSDNQRVSIYGLPRLVLSSGATSYTASPYTALTFGPYPYATSTNTLAKFALPLVGGTQQYIATGSYASATVSTSDPSAALSLSAWSWYVAGTRLGAVSDPSVSRVAGPSGFNAAGQRWVSLDITWSNPGKPVGVVDEVLQGPLPRPTATVSFPDFSVGLARSSSSDPSATSQDPGLRVAGETFLGQTSIAKINPSSSGELAASAALQRNGARDAPPSDPAVAACWVPLNNGQSPADVSSTTIPVSPRVIPDSDPSLIPTASAAATAVVLSSTPGIDGVDPMSPNSPTPPVIQSSFSRLQRVSLHPGATLTFRVRMLLGAAHLADSPGANFTLLFVARAREVSVSSGVETTDVLFSGVADYPEVLNVCSETAPPAARTRSPLERQEWAQLLSLYNRSLRLNGRRAGQDGSF